eukprot:scaffold1435_cov267-Pinguiococcus_pyrenoidosus.AAC.5
MHPHQRSSACSQPPRRVLCVTHWPVSERRHAHHRVASSALTGPILNMPVVDNVASYRWQIASSHGLSLYDSLPKPSPHSANSRSLGSGAS